MSSKNKKNKAVNCYFHNGLEKSCDKMKRHSYFNKRQRNEIKKESIKIFNEYAS